MPPLFCYTRTPGVDWTGSEVLYPLFTWRRFGTEYRIQLMQLLSFSGGKAQAGPDTRLFTLFPLYFQRRSDDPNLNYTALVPLAAICKTGSFTTTSILSCFRFHAETRKQEVVTDNIFIHSSICGRAGM